MRYASRQSKAAVRLDGFVGVNVGEQRAVDKESGSADGCFRWFEGIKG